MKFNATISIVIIFFGLFLINACNNHGNRTNQQKTDLFSEASLQTGEKLYKAQCLSCHTKADGSGNRLAPPFHNVKMHYKGDETSFDSFSKEIKTYLKNPSVENSRMPGAIEKFGKMPQIDFDEEELNLILAYIYTTDFERGHGKRKNQNEQRFSEREREYIHAGRELAMNTKAILGKNLMAALNNGGAEHAMSFCNENAQSLTNSLAPEMGMSIKRVTDKPRNPQNRANEYEMAVIEKMKATIEKHGEPKPQLFEDSTNKTMFTYYGITTNNMCLQCHGTPEKEILTETMTKISTLYPNDLAIGYNANELRGMWVVAQKLID